jgi:MFS family permease
MSERPEAMDRRVTATFLRWTFARAIFHRGYVLVSSLYFVLTGHLSGSQLLVLATVMAMTLVLSDIPFGVWSDAFSRKWPLVIGHVFLAAGMVMTGLVTSFPLLLVTQVLWGLGWAFSTGADVAWITDESNQPDRIDRVLTARARWDLIGGAAGMTVFGVLGWVIGLGTAIVLSGSAMALVGLYVAVSFVEDNFSPATTQKWKSAVSIFQRGVSLSRRDHEVLLMLLATFIVNGAAMVSWVFPKQLVDRGFPSSPVLWYTALGVVSFGAGVLALHLVESRIEGVGVARRTYALTCFVGTLGLLVLAVAPTALLGSVGIVLVGGVSFNVTRAVSTIWVNRRTPADIRATMHSFLSQAESVGEIVGGAALAGVAKTSGVEPTIVASAALMVLVGTIIVRSRADRSGASEPDTGDAY